MAGAERTKSSYLTYLVTPGGQRSFNFTTDDLKLNTGEEYDHYILSVSSSGGSIYLYSSDGSTRLSSGTEYTKTSLISYVKQTGHASVIVKNNGATAETVKLTIKIYYTDGTYRISYITHGEVSPDASPGTVTISPSFYVMPGDIVTLVATPYSKPAKKHNYAFLNFTSTGVTIVMQDETTGTFTMPSKNVTVTCNFIALADNVVGYYNGTEFVPCTVNYYDGTEFVECETYYYDGTEWVPISTS